MYGCGENTGEGEAGRRSMLQEKEIYRRQLGTVYLEHYIQHNRAMHSTSMTSFASRVPKQIRYCNVLKRQTCEQTLLQGPRCCGD
jgi:hypothetical protein